jgi:XTP/dITP diphosphohydrolase
MKRVLIATSNPGKLRDFAGAAAEHGIEIASVPDFDRVPAVLEDGTSFEDNARKKAEYYSPLVPGELVLADDSGLEVNALDGAPGVRSARYAGEAAQENSSDAANNARLLRELQGLPAQQRSARFVCVIAAAQNGKTLQMFRGEVEGVILEAPRGNGGFGYDPLFYVPAIGKTFAQLEPEEKSRFSHRGEAFRKFMTWMDSIAASYSPDSCFLDFPSLRPR